MISAFLANFLFWSGLSIGAVVFVAFVDVTGGQWLGPMRVTAARFRRFLPISLALFVVLLWKRADIYPWARETTHALWSHSTTIVVRDAIALVAVYATAFAYCGFDGSNSNNSTPAGTTRQAIGLLIVYAAGFSIVAVDLIMSLEPRWDSTLFPAYVFTGNVYAGAATVAAVAVWTKGFADASSRVRDMANVLVALALFWLYLFWSQFLVIWYGNITSEVGFLMARANVSRATGWLVLGLAGALPPIVLVPQWGKRITTLRIVTPLILLGLWLERWLIVSPAMQASSTVAVVAITAGFGFLFAVSVMSFANERR